MIINYLIDFNLVKIKIMKFKVVDETFRDKSK